MASDPPLTPELSTQLDGMPEELDAAGQQLWRSVASVWVLRPDELRLLTDAANEADLIERLQDEVRARSLIATGSQGQPVAAPCVSELRMHRATLASLLKHIHLPDEEDDERTLTKSQRSAAARSAARARWDRPRGA